MWDYAEGMELMRHFWDAAVALDPAAARRDQGVRFPICNPARLEAMWRYVGMVDVISKAIDIPTIFRSFDEYWTPLLGGQGRAPGYVMSLDENHRADVRDYIRAHLLIAEDGSISLGARAWAIRGRSA